MKSNASRTEGFDLVIKGGRVIDPETGLDAVRDVGVRDCKVTAVTENGIEGKEAIDAKGHVVAPGFIDMHHHNATCSSGRSWPSAMGLPRRRSLREGHFR